MPHVRREAAVQHVNERGERHMQFPLPLGQLQSTAVAGWMWTLRVGGELPGDTCKLAG